MNLDLPASYYRSGCSIPTPNGSVSILQELEGVSKILSKSSQHVYGKHVKAKSIKFKCKRLVRMLPPFRAVVKFCSSNRLFSHVFPQKSCVIVCFVFSSEKLFFSLYRNLVIFFYFLSYRPMLNFSL